MAMLTNLLGLTEIAFDGLFSVRYDVHVGAWRATRSSGGGGRRLTPGRIQAAGTWRVSGPSTRVDVPRPVPPARLHRTNSITGRIGELLTSGSQKGRPRPALGLHTRNLTADGGGVLTGPIVAAAPGDAFPTPPPFAAASKVVVADSSPPVHTDDRASADGERPRSAYLPSGSPTPTATGQPGSSTDVTTVNSVEGLLAPVPAAPPSGGAAGSEDPPEPPAKPVSLAARLFSRSHHVRTNSSVF